MRFTFPFLLILIFGFNCLQAQNPTIPKKENRVDANGLRQGEWAVWLNVNYQQVDNSDSVVIYRLINYENDKPIGVVKDFYRSGVLQWEGKLLEDRPHERLEGQAVWYREDGTKQLEREYEMNVIVRENSYDEQGNLLKEYVFPEHSIGFNKGQEYFVLGNYEKAIELLEKNYPIIDSLGLIDDKVKLGTLERMRISYQELGNDLEAKRLEMRMQALKLSITDIQKLREELFNSGKYEEVLLLVDEVYKVYRQELDSNPTSIASMASLIGLCQEKLGNLQKAYEYHLKAERTIRQLPNRNEKEYMEKCYQLGYTLNRLKKYDSATILLQRPVDYYRNRPEEIDPKRYPIYLNALAINELDLQNYALAEPLFDELFRLPTLSEHPSYSFYCNNYGLLYNELKKYRKAEKYYLKSLDLEEKNPAKSTNSLLYTYTNLSSFYLAQSRYDEANSYARKAEKIFNEMPNQSSIKKDFRFYTSLVTAYMSAGNNERGIPLCKQAIQRMEVAGGEGTTHWGLFNKMLVSMYMNIEKWAEAEKIMAELLEAESRKEEKSRYIPVLLSLQAKLYEFLERKEEARKLLNQALEMAQEMQLGAKEVADIKTNLADIYSKFEEYDNAEKLYLQLIDFYKSEENTKSYLHICNNLSTMYGKEKKYDLAYEYQMKSLKSRKREHGKESLEYAKNLHNLGFITAYQKNYEKSLELLLESRKIQLANNAKENRVYLLTLQGLGSLLDNHLNKNDKAEKYYEEASQLHIARVKKNFSYLSEKEKELFIKDAERYFRAYNRFALKVIHEKPYISASVFNNTLNTKGLLFNSSRKMQEVILASGDSILQAKYEDWKFKKASLANAYGLPAQERENLAIDLEEMEREVNQLEKELSYKSQLFSKSKAEDILYTWKDAQSKLQPKEALVEVLQIPITEDSIAYLALIVKPDTKDFPETVILQNGSELEGKALKYYQTTIKYKVQNELSYDAYWKPISEKLAGIEKVYFSADGVYHKISLASLQNPETGKYLLDELEIQLLTNTKDLLVPKRERKPSRKIELFGNPNYSGEKSEKTATELSGKLLKSFIESDTTQRFMNEGSIAPLPGTKVEVEKISVIASKSDFSNRIYTSEQATEAEIKQVQNPKVLHIATHGYFLEDAKTANSESEMMMGVEKSSALENPLLRAGLLFANAENAISQGGDGILTAKEAMNLSLEETELVVLSACETGLGAIKNGEGVYGLQRAFQSAGAQSILMSLWTVSDKATEELMVSFYENWLQKKQDKRTAFRNAQLNLRDKYPEPFFWSAFVLVGE